MVSDEAHADVLGSLREVAVSAWDVATLEQDILLSQRQRRLIERSHQDGHRPVWDTPPSDPTRRWLLRDKGLYNDWAWLGVDGA